MPKLSASSAHACTHDLGLHLPWTSRLTLLARAGNVVPERVMEWLAKVFLIIVSPPPRDNKRLCSENFPSTLATFLHLLRMMKAFGCHAHRLGALLTSLLDNCLVTAERCPTTSAAPPPAMGTPSHTRRRFDTGAHVESEQGVSMCTRSTRARARACTSARVHATLACMSDHRHERERELAGQREHARGRVQEHGRGQRVMISYMIPQAPTSPSSWL